MCWEPLQIARVTTKIALLLKFNALSANLAIGSKPMEL